MKEKYLLIPISDIEQRYKELNDNRKTLSEYWLGELHGIEKYLELGEKILLNEGDLSIILSKKS